MPWHPLHYLCKQKKPEYGAVWPLPVGITLLLPHRGRRVPLTGHIVPLGHVADEILGQRAGTGGTGGRFPPQDNGGISGADIDGHHQRICERKDPGGFCFRSAPPGVKAAAGAPARTRTVAGVAMPQGEGGPAPLRVPAVHGEAVTARRSQRSWGGTGGAGQTL